jgi:hypothetical protein
MPHSRPYKARSLTGAQARVRMLEKQRDQAHYECQQLAKLAATGPTFFNPMDVWNAEAIRDRILLACGLNPDGSFIPKEATDAK